MAGGNKNIHNHPKANTNGFDKNPQNIGNKPKTASLVSLVKDYLENDGYTIFNKVDLLDENGIVTGEKVNVRIKLLNSKTVVSHYLNRAKKNDRVLIDLFNRIGGKPDQNINLNNGIDIMKGYERLNDVERIEFGRLLEKMRGIESKED